MSDFDDFSIDSNTSSAVIKVYSTDLRNTGSFLHTTCALPAIYYDFKAQQRHSAKLKATRPTFHESGPGYVSPSTPPQQESQSDESSTQD
jgi:hypothetical protein